MMTAHDDVLITVHDGVLNPAFVVEIKLISEEKTGSPTAKEHRVQAVLAVPPHLNYLAYLTGQLTKQQAEDVFVRAVDILYGRADRGKWLP